MRIDRPQVDQAFEAFARGGSGVVIGAPGSGKTYSLKALVGRLLEDDTAYPLFLAVDRFDELSESSLATELGIEGDVFAALESDAGQAIRAYFIVDALDAARSDKGRTQLVNLIRRAQRELSDRWSVIVSVRTYDAQRSEQLEAIFGPVDRDIPEDYRLPGVACRHFFIPLLTEEEVLSIDIPTLADIWRGSSDELRAILCTPFALWLLDRVVSSGGLDQVEGLKSEVELLALFWRLRVDAGERAIERRLILERLTDAMLEARSLSASTASVYRSSEQAAWHDLHSGEVVASTTSGHSRTAFSHNILFDYAISLLSIDSTTDGLTTFLEEDPSRALFLRPSLNYFFLRLWLSDRSAFWANLYAIAESAESQVRLFTRVLPPTIIAGEARDPSDLDPLLERIGLAPSASEIALRVLQALRFAGVPRPIVWSTVCEQLAAKTDASFIWDIALVLDRLLEIEGEPEIEQRVANAARTLLRWSLEHRASNPTAERAGSVWFVPLVARTIATNVEASSALLQRVIDGIGDEAVPVDYAYRLASQLDDVWQSAPELASAFFVRCFSHEEFSDEPTHMGGIVIALRSNRRQDYQMVQWTLKERAPAFLRGAPRHAVPALIQAIDAQIEMNELRHQTQAVPERKFVFNGVPAVLRRDGSHFWDATGTIREDAQELMDALVGFLEELADAERWLELDDALLAIAENAQMAFVWRRLMVAAERHPEVLFPRLFDLLVAAPIIGSLETVREAAEFLAAALPLMSEEQALAVEEAVVALGDEEEDAEDSPVGRLIQRFPDNRLQTPEGQRLKKLTQANVNATTNRPLVEFHTSSSAYTEEMWLAERGVDVTEDTAVLLSELGKPVAAFEDEFRNADPPKERIDEVIEDLRRLRQAVRDAREVPEALEDATWAKLGGVAALLARYQAALEAGHVSFVREILLESASGRAPHPKEVDDFTTPAWSPAARNEAAQGLPFLAPTTEDIDVIAAIERLTQDRVPSVRWLIAVELWRVCESAPDVFWNLVERYLRNETNAAVIDAVARSLGAVATTDRQPQVEAALKVLLERHEFSVGTNRRFKAEDQLSNLLVGLAVGRGSEWATGVIRGPLERLPASGPEATGYTWFALQYLHVDRVDIPDFEPSSRRALTWLIEAVRMAAEAIRRSASLQEAPDGLKETFGILDEVVTRLYFNSGVYVSHDRPVPPGSICQFFALTKELLTILAEEVGGERATGLPASTAHHFVELLRGVVRCDPATVVHLARLVVAAAGASGYAFDSLASREVTQLVEQVLADHREVFRQGEPLEDLLFLLDTFVASGSPDAQRLVFRLEEIFR